MQTYTLPHRSFANPKDLIGCLSLSRVGSQPAAPIIHAPFPALIPFYADVDVCVRACVCVCVCTLSLFVTTSLLLYTNQVATTC